MADEWSILQSAISAAAGLGGVWLGGTLTGRREEKRENQRVAKESDYLAILVVAHLDRLANSCLHVALDDGTSEGRPAGEHGYYEPTVATPKFSPLSFEVDWKVLPQDLMYEILNLPYRIEQLESHVAGAWEFDDPPDFAEFFWTRRYGFAELGLEVSALATKLRQHAHLPVAVAKDDEWNRDACLREQIQKVTTAKASFRSKVCGKSCCT